MNKYYDLETETDELKINFIRVKNEKKEFVSIANGRVWKTAADGFELLEKYVE